MQRFFAGVISLAAILASTRLALANGRFPAAGYVVVGPGSASTLVVLRTTFGVLRSVDSGSRWQWVCEEAVDAVGMFDPSVALGFDGNTVLSLPVGLSVSPDGCAWRRPDNTPRRPVVDVSHDASGRVVVAGVGPSGTQDAILRSDDGGHTWRMGATLPGYFLETVEVAPNAVRRVYATGFVPGPEAVFLRSDDGGGSMRETTRDFAGGTSAWIAGVDPANEDVVYVRSQRPGGVGTFLSKSTDAGRSFRRIAETRGEMRGFALSDDGSTVWFGSTDAREGLQRSVRGGAFARTGSQPSVQCLRYHAGLLYVCASEAVDGYALGCSRDGGETVTPLLSLRALEVEPTCPSGSQVGDRCSMLWPAQRALLRAIDAGAVPDVTGHDAREVRDASEVTDVSARDASVMDASDEVLPQRRSDCGCGVEGARREERWWAWAACAAALAGLRRRGARTVR